MPRQSSTTAAAGDGEPEHGDGVFHEIESLRKALSLAPITSTDRRLSLSPPRSQKTNLNYHSKWAWVNPLKALTHLRPHHHCRHRRRTIVSFNGQKTSQKISQIGEHSGSLRRAGSVPGLDSGSGFGGLPTGEVRVLYEVVSRPEQEMCQKGLVNEGFENDELDFVVIDKGIEISVKYQLEKPLAIAPGDDNKGGGIEVKDEVTKLDDQIDEFGYEQSGSLSEDLSFDKLDVALEGLSIVEDEDLQIPKFNAGLPDVLGYSNVKSSYKLNRAHNRSFSFDDAAEAITDEFLSMLGAESSNNFSTCSNQVLPTEFSLKYSLQKESQTSSGNLLLLEAGMHKDPSLGNLSKDLQLQSIVQAAEHEDVRAIQSMQSKMRARMLEEAEAEALMLAWGLDEKAFAISAQRDTGAFGSPIELSP